MLEEFERAVQDCKQYHRRTIQTHRALQNICESLQEVENADEIVQVSTNCLEEIANKLKSLASQHPPKYADVSTLQKRSDAPSSPFHGLPSEGNSPRLPQAGSIGKSDKPPLLGLQRSSSASLSINGKKLVSQLVLLFSKFFFLLSSTWILFFPVALVHTHIGSSWACAISCSVTV